MTFGLARCLRCESDQFEPKRQHETIQVVADPRKHLQVSPTKKIQSNRGVQGSVETSPLLRAFRFIRFPMPFVLPDC
jgi:hypothetical protein